VIEMPGGGGLGDPKARSTESVADDVRAGLVSREMARDSYGVVIDAAGNVDIDATGLARRGAAE
jgi:N-methylhydantoinase B